MDDSPCHTITPEFLRRPKELDEDQPFLTVGLNREGMHMQGRELRAAARIAVSRRGKLNSGETWFPCMVLDMSDDGFLMVCNKDLSVGQILDFKCELFPAKVLDCKLQIRHFSDTGLGTKIVQIDPKGHNLCQLFLQEQYSEKLNKLG